MDREKWKAFLAHMAAFEWSEELPSVSDGDLRSPYYDLEDVRLSQADCGSEWMARILPGQRGRKDTPNDITVFGSSRQDALLTLRYAAARMAPSAGYKKLADLPCNAPKSHQMAPEGVQTGNLTLPIALTAESPEPPPWSVVLVGIDRATAFQRLNDGRWVSPWDSFTWEGLKAATRKPIVLIYVHPPLSSLEE